MFEIPDHACGGCTHARAYAKLTLNQVELIERCMRAVAARQDLLNETMNAARLIDGAGDHLPRFYLEEYAGRWLVMTKDCELSYQLRAWLQESGRTVWHKKLTNHSHEAPQWLCGSDDVADFVIAEHGMNYAVSFQSGYSQGIFLDQRLNRLAVFERSGPGQRVLNLFAYTGAFSVVAASAGAETSTLDLSSHYLNWAKKNFLLNGLDPSCHHFCKGDAFHWLERFARQGRRFDGVIVDPPTFSRNAAGKVFRVERDYGELANLAAAVVAPGGWLLCCTNHRGTSREAFARMVLRAPLLARKKATFAQMPPDFCEEPYLKSLWIE